MTAIQNLRDSAYAFAMWILCAVRFLITWIYFLVSIACFRALSESRFTITLGGFVAISFLVLATFVSGAAWWTTLRNGRTQRIWVILFALGCLLIARIGGPISSRYMLAYTFILGPALTGVLVFLLPYRLHLSAHVASSKSKKLARAYESEPVTGPTRWGRTCLAGMFLVSAGRLGMIWAYWVLVTVGAEGLWEGSEGLSPFFSKYHIFPLAGAALIALPGLAAGWTALRKSRTQRIWALLASIEYLLIAICVFLNPSTRHAAHTTQLLVIGLAGSMLYLLPYQLRWSVDSVNRKFKIPAHAPEEMHFVI